MRRVGSPLICALSNWRNRPLECDVLTKVGMDKENQQRKSEGGGPVRLLITMYWRPSRAWRTAHNDGLPARKAVRASVLLVLCVTVCYCLLNLGLGALAYMASPAFGLSDITVSDIQLIGVRAAAEVLVFFIWTCVSLGVAFAIGGDIRPTRGTIAKDGASLAWFAARWMLCWLFLFAVLWHLSFPLASTFYFFLVSFGCAFLFVLLLSAGLAVFAFRYFWTVRWEGRWRRCAIIAVLYSVVCTFLYREVWYWGGKTVCWLLHLPRWRALTLWMYPEYWDHRSPSFLWHWLLG